MTVEFFDIGLDCLRATWWRKPSLKRLIEQREIIIRKGIKNNIGIDNKIIERIIELYNKFENNNIINVKEHNLNKISSSTELPLSLIKIILIKKGIIK